MMCEDMWLPCCGTLAAVPEFREARVDLARERLHALAIEHDSLTEVAVVDRSITVPMRVCMFVAWRCMLAENKT